MTLEDLTPEQAMSITPEEIRLRIRGMNDKETLEFYEKLPLETRNRFQVYTMQRTREILSGADESPEQ